MFKKVRVGRRWVLLAACVVLLSCTGLLLLAGCRDGNIPSGAIREVLYPKAYAFDDFDARIRIGEENPVDDSFMAALNEFSYRTGSLILEGAGENMNYSPLSLYYALSLAASGARGDTEAELLALLGVPDRGFLSEQCGNLYRVLYRDNEIGRLKIANSLWMDDDMNGEPVVFKEDFVRQAAENFYAASHSVDFAGDAAGEAMAKWISANTNGTLTPEIKTDPEQILSILNTVYFYDQWIDRFDESKTAAGPFHLSDGTDVSCDFMNQAFGSAGFARGESFTRAGLALKNGGQMVFVLPDEGISPCSLLASPEQMREIFEGGKDGYGQVTWKIPRFSFGSALELVDVLKALGVSAAFAADADFTGITDHLAFISDVHQETHIAIDEKGVEASAFTRIDYFGAALPEDRAEMILDRPFLYAITAPGGGLLFVGLCENPVE